MNVNVVSLSFTVSQVLRQIIHLLSVHAVKKLVLDFESGLWGAVRSVLPDVTVQGCVFHWTQAVWRKVRRVTFM